MERGIGLSGFTFVRDAIRLDYPVVESIRSALPIVDEYVVNVGDCTDDTLGAIEAIGDPRIVILRTDWDPSRFVAGATNADQTNIALDRCTMPWRLYLQADELIHEEDFPAILEAVAEADARPDIEGILFHYNHFWGDYDRVHRGHNWYDRDIRIVRGLPGIRSWRSAQSFRRDGRKLRVIDSGAWIYHYGWVRHPLVMKRKKIALDSLHHDPSWVRENNPEPERPWDYGPLEGIPLFTGTHPAVMRDRIAAKDWDAADFSDPDDPPDHEHLRLGCRVHSALERLVGRRIGGYRNWELAGRRGGVRA